MSRLQQDQANSSPTSSTESDDTNQTNDAAVPASKDSQQQQQQQNQQQQQQALSSPTKKPQGGFYPSSGPAKDPFAVALLHTLPANTPHVGIERARALRRQWLTQTRPLPQPREEPDFDELEEAFEDEVPFDPPVHLPNLLLMLLDIWEEEGLLN
jgi:hypothetical protein